MESSPTSFSSSGSEVVHEFRFFKVYGDGRIEKYRTTSDRVPPITDPATGVESKDVTISPQVSVRIFKPSMIHTSSPSSDHLNRKLKLPLMLYIHGGGFCLDSAFSSRHHNYVSTLVARAQIIAVSVDYGLFPDRPLPACYEDSWAALRWVASHLDGSGPEPWLNSYADLGRLFLVGNSAGGNISHYLASQMASVGLPAGVSLAGMVLIHPYFGGTDDDRMWLYMFLGGDNGGLGDPRLRPGKSELAAIPCDRVLVFVGELDHLGEVGKSYCEDLKGSGWRGTVELVENKGEGHCFYWFDFDGEESQSIINHIVAFITQIP
ncbi:hypothetical protein Dimus_032864 [Dionaea muscipula]